MNILHFTLAVVDRLGSRLGLCAAATVVGVLFILMGRNNIRTRTAEESGKRRWVNSALGKSNTYEGTKAVVVGWVRVFCGIVAIVFGMVFLFLGFVSQNNLE